MRNILAVIAGIITGGFTIAFFQWIGTALFASDVPYPETYAEWDLYIDQLPFMSKFMVIVSYAVAGFAAGTVATFIQGRTAFRPALVATSVLQLLAWMNMISIAHPFWMWLLGSVVILPAGYFAFRYFRRRRDDPSMSN
jgi:hypothetical protein